MKVFYAMGGGMGHVYRTWVLTQQFGLLNFKVVTSNTLAKKLFIEDQLLFIDPNDYHEAWGDFIHSILPQLDVKEFYIDAFPLGIFGELSCLRQYNFPIHYLARRVKWKEYEPVIGNSTINFDTTFVLEPLEPNHDKFVKDHSGKVEELQLHYPVAQPVAANYAYILQYKKIWLVVHAFNKDEVEVMLHYAQEAARLEAADPYFLVLSDQQVVVTNGRCMHYPTVVDWFPVADRIFIAGGFNSVQQVLPFIPKTSFVPFPRRYDDQAWRVKLARDRTNVLK